jgi:hypothetical protein
MSEFIPWNSQPLDLWADRYTEGKSIDLAGRRIPSLSAGRASLWCCFTDSIQIPTRG